MNIKKKFLLILLIVNIFVALIYLNNFEVRADFILDMEKQAGNFVSAGETGAKGFDTSSITDNFKGLGKFLTMIGAGVMVAVTSYMGIKYIISPPDKQAALKQQLIGVVAAGIVIFGAYGIWSAILKVVSQF